MAEERFNNTERSTLARILCGVLWFIPIYFIINFAIGAIVGGIAGAHTQSYEAGYSAGQAASMAFFQSFGIFILLGEFALTIWLSVIGALPGTAKWKKA